MSRKLSPPSKDLADLERRRLQEEAHWRTTRQIAEVHPIVFTIATSAPEGWLMLNGETIGKNGSGATHEAPGLKALFAHLWDNVANAQLAILNSDGTAGSRGASAQADWAASKRMPLPNAKGRCFIGTGQGSGLTSRTHGATGGAETHQLSVAEMPAHDHTVNGNVLIQNGAGANVTVSGSAAGGFTGSTGGGGAHNNMQPWLALNSMIKT